MYLRFDKSSSVGNPVMQVLSLLIFGVLVIGAVVMGAIVLSLLLAAGAIVAAVFAVRIWWIRRKLQQAAGQAPSDPHGQDNPPGHLLDAEYTVVSEDKTRRRRRHESD